MRNDYCIIKGTHSSYNAIVVGLSRNSLTDYFEEISHDLTNNNIKGKILLDYYSYNHSTKRRFFEVDFENNTISASNVKKVQNSEILEIVHKCYSSTQLLQTL